MPLVAAMDRAWDHLNPIVVKEVRQGLRARIFWTSFGLMLTAFVVISITAYGDVAHGGYEAKGPRYFGAYFLCLAAIQFFVIPYTAYRSVVREREEETWPLLALTGLGARRILGGKVGSFLLQALLYGSVAAPFVIFSYFLNGIDLGLIVRALALAIVHHVFLTVVCVSAGTFGGTRLVRAMVHFAVLWLLFQGTIGLVGISTFFSAGGGRVLGVAYGEISELLQLTVVAISYAAVFFESAVARLSLPTEDYAKGPRLALLAQVITAIGLAVVVWLENRSKSVWPVLQFWACANLFVAGLFVVSDRDGMSRALSSKRGIGLLRPGALRGYVFLLLLLALATAVSIGLYRVTRHSIRTRDASTLVAAALYVVIYLSAPLLWQRRRRGTANPGRERALGVASLAAGIIGPLLVGGVLGDFDQPWINLLNPIVGLFAFDDGDLGPAGLAILGVVAACLVAATYSVLARRDREAQA